MEDNFNENEYLGFESDVQETDDVDNQNIQEQEDDYEGENEQEQVEDNQYYSLEELDDLGDDTEIDMDRIPPSIKRLIDRASKQDVVPEDEKLRVPTFNVSGELDLNQVEFVNNKALRDVVEHLANQGIEYDDSNSSHRQLFKEHKASLMIKAKEIIKNQQTAKFVEQDLRGKYGKNFEAIDRMVVKYIEDELPASKSREIRQRVMNGDTKLMYEIYNTCSKKLFNNNNIGNSKKKAVFPPKSMNGGKNVKQKPKQLTESYFL